MLGSELRGKQLGLVGFGRIGRAVAAKAAGIRHARRLHDPPPTSSIPGAQATVARSAAQHVRHRVAARAADAETRHLIDRTGAGANEAVGVSRSTRRADRWWTRRRWPGRSQQRLIAGAALDVYENEPAVHPDLLTLENVLLVPHLGSGTTETRTAMADLAVDNVVAVLARAAAADAGDGMKTARAGLRDDRRRCRHGQPSARNVEAVMRALARAIDGLELPAVEKISESQEEDPFQVLIATLLSARTQDATTLAASTRLFKVARTPRTMAKLTVKQIERLIYPVSFYRHKARHVKATCRLLVERFGGRVPATMEELLTLPGVGRKTANLVLILAFKSQQQHLRRHARPSHLESPGMGADARRPKRPSRRCTGRPPSAGGRTSTCIS